MSQKIARIPTEFLITGNIAHWIRTNREFFSPAGREKRKKQKGRWNIKINLK